MVFGIDRFCSRQQDAGKSGAAAEVRLHKLWIVVEVLEEMQMDVMRPGL